MISNPTILNAMNTDVSRLLFLADINWPTGHVYTHSRAGEKYWDSRKWIGVGQFASIENASSGVQLGDMNMTLQTTDLAIVNDAIKDNAVGRDVKIYLACTDEHRRIIAAELIIYRFIGRVPVETGPVNTIQLNLVGARARFKSAKKHLRYSAKSWRRAYPDDSYCDDVEALASSPLNTYDGSNSVGRGGRGDGSTTNRRHR
ncbi:hypothetical protein C6Y40_03875 [Alteromonas alba]|uniref:DUF2163 domain-containing protein n=1 Tax=Alteromonas alba TaxID=2079529 RepID=A0A2S9VEQ5_9ALTE|nr:hypothetical protein [Alteromonas alba]PRO74942.1 hypothetical protein C6Y40_03875 [Alteromonas alba]